MRIIAGECKGRPLLSVKGIYTRPTADRVKESIFNVIQSYVYDSLVLDLFSGTGNMGLEALSRGARHAFFVEKNKNAASVIKQNCSNLHYLDRSNIMIMDFESAIIDLSNSDSKFDIIFADPPYNKNFEIKILKVVDQNDILQNSGIMLIEHSLDDVLTEKIGNLKKYDIRKYGNTCISLYRKDAF